MPVEISFNSKEIRAICDGLDDPPPDLETIADALKARIADLRAADHVSDIAEFWPNTSSNSLHYAMDLDGNHQLIFESGHSNPRNNTEGQNDWSKVTRIKILEISRSN